MSITRRKLPPFAKNFFQHDPDLPLAFLYFGPLAWTAKEQLDNRSVILPPDEPSEAYDWSFLRGQCVIGRALGETEEKYRKRLAYELLLAGADPVHFFLPKKQGRLIGDGYDIQLTELWVPHEHYVRRKK
jgi:hypothetical protein